MILHCAPWARCGALSAQPNGPYGYVREEGRIRDFSGRWLSGSTAPHIVVSAMSVPSDACNSKHQHMSSWSYHSQWCIGGTHERRGVSRQEKGTSKGLDHLPVSAGWSSCWRPGQRLEEAPWPIAGPCSPFTDRIRGQLAGSLEPVLAGSRLARRGPALSLATNYELDASHSMPRHASSYMCRHPKHCSALPARAGMVRASCRSESRQVVECAPRVCGGDPAPHS